MIEEMSKEVPQTAEVKWEKTHGNAKQKAYCVRAFTHGIVLKLIFHNQFVPGAVEPHH